LILVAEGQGERHIASTDILREEISIADMILNKLESKDRTK